MSKFVGRRGALGLAKEATRGTIVSPPTFWIPRTTISFDDRVVGAQEQEGLGRLADSDAWFVTQKNASGDFEIQLDDRNLPIILTSLMGASPAKAGANPYTFTYTLANTNQHQSLSIAYQDPDFTKVFPMAVVDQLQISVAQNAIVTAKAAFMSRVSKDWVTLTPDFTSQGSKFLHQHLQFRIASAIAGLGAAPEVSLKKLDITIKANAEFDSVLGTVEPQDILNQQFSIEGTLEINKQDDSWRQLMLNGTYQAMDITFVNGANSKFQMQFPRVNFTAWEQDRTLDNIVSQKINFKANYDAANAVEIISTCIVTNNLNATTY